jgi:hypothetical protein
VATEQDVREKSAIFFVRPAEPQTPLPVEIPQYAIWRDKSGRSVQAVLVQAKGLGSENLLGLRSFDGEEIVALLAKVTLLGAAPQ